MTLQKSEAVVRRYSLEKMFLEISQNSQENTCARVSFSVRLQASRWNFAKFLRTPFLQNTSGGCFSKVVLFWGQVGWVGGNHWNTLFNLFNIYSNFSQSSNFEHKFCKIYNQKFWNYVGPFADVIIFCQAH